MKANSIKIQYPEDYKLMEVVLTTNRSNITIQENVKYRNII